MSQDRDTHFAGFAKLLYEEMREELDVDIDIPATSPHTEQIQRLIARRAYDLALHTMCAYDDINREFALEMIDHVPDMTAWPEQSE